MIVSSLKSQNTKCTNKSNLSSAILQTYSCIATDICYNHHQETLKNYRKEVLIMAGLTEPMNEEKFDKLIIQLFHMGYETELSTKTSTTGLIDIIEGHQLDLSNFDFPEGNWQNFKQALLAGKYDLDKDYDQTNQNIETIDDFITNYIQGKATGFIDVNPTKQEYIIKEIQRVQQEKHHN